MCPQLSLGERRSRGTEAAAQVPPQAHRGWEPAPGRPSPVLVLAEQEADRLSDLVPVRHGRMMISPFTFYRGAAAVMSQDLRDTPVAREQAKMAKRAAKRAARAAEKARTRDSMQALSKLGESVGDSYRIVSQPPVLIPLRELAFDMAPDMTPEQIEEGIRDQFDRSVTNFAIRYADQNERDYAEFVAAIRSGQLTAVEGV